MIKNKTLLPAVLLLAGTLAFSGCGQTSSTDSSETTSSDTQENTASSDDVFSNLTTTDLDGNTIDSSIFKDHKLTVINAWNIGCTPCIEELPALEQLNQEYADKEVSIKGLYFNFAEEIKDDEMAQIKDTLSTANVSYPQLRLTKDMYNFQTMQDVMAFPTTFFVDSNGKIIDKLEGSHDYEEWKSIIDSYLEQAQ